MRAGVLFAAEALMYAGGRPRVYSSTEMAGISVAIVVVSAVALIVGCFS